MKHLKSLPALAVGIIFLFAGVMKLFVIGPATFSGILEQVIGFGPRLAIVASWVVTLVEIIGGLSILSGKFFPSKKIFTLVLSLLMVVILVALVFTNILVKPVDIMGLLNNILILSVLVSLLPLGKKSCICTDGSCNC